MKRLIFFLVIIMIVPLGAIHGEAAEKNEVERIEYFSQTHKYFTKQQKKKSQTGLKYFITIERAPVLHKTSFSPSFFVQNNRKIYLFKRSLLL